MNAVEGEPASAAMPGAAPFVWTVWAAMLLLALIYVGRFSSRLPFFDDWALVPLLAGTQPLTPAYLWEPLTEHRVPLPKLVLYALGYFAGFDFRAGMVLNVALLAGLSFAMLHTIGRLRGGLHFADGFFPLVLLSVAQWECFLLSYAINHVGSTVVAGVFLVLLAGGDARVSPGRAVGMAVCLLLLPLFGANGLVLVPALAGWLGLVAILHIRAADTRRQGWLVLVLVAAALLLCGVYFVGLPHLGAGPTPAQALARGRQVLGMLFGASGLPWTPLKAGVVPLALLAGGGVWLTAWLRRPQERIVLLGMLAFLLALACLIAAIAWGRGDYLRQTAFVPRYATLMLPLGCWLYFLAARYGGVSAGSAGQMALFLLAAVVFAPNLRAAFDDGRCRRRALRNFEADLALRLPPALLAECGAGRVFQAEQQEDVTRYIRTLRDSGAGAFRLLPEHLSLRAVVVPPSACIWRGMTLADGVARPTGDHPTVSIALPQVRFVRFIRLRYAYTNGRGSGDFFQLSWRPDTPDRAALPSRIRLDAHPSDGEGTATVSVNARIDGFRLVPRIKLFNLRLVTIELLVPESAVTAPSSLPTARAEPSS